MNLMWWHILSLLFSLKINAEDSFKVWGGVFAKNKISNKTSFWIEDQLRLNGDKELMLKGLRDYLYAIPGKLDITKEVKAYFKKNGYDFMNPEEEEDDDDWDDDW